MSLLTEWEGRTGKYLARGHAVRTELLQRGPRPRAKYFPVRTDQTQSISILSYDLLCITRRAERARLVTKDPYQMPRALTQQRIIFLNERKRNCTEEAVEVTTRIDSLQFIDS